MPSRPFSFSKVSVLNGATVSRGRAPTAVFCAQDHFQWTAAVWSLFSSCGKRLALTYQHSSTSVVKVWRVKD
jgi:hypothetical protein